MNEAMARKLAELRGEVVNPATKVFGYRPRKFHPATIARLRRRKARKQQKDSRRRNK